MTNSCSIHGNYMLKQHPPMLPLDTIYNEDCLQGMRRMGDGTVDCRSLRPAVPAGQPGRRLLVEERGLGVRRLPLGFLKTRVARISDQGRAAAFTARLCRLLLKGRWESVATERRFSSTGRTEGAARAMPSEGAARAVSSSLEYCRVASEFEELKCI